MKKLLALVCLFAAVALAAADFTNTLTPAERAATGLAKLSPEELAQLKAVVERYKLGTPPVPAAPAGTAAPAPARPAANAEAKKPGWLKSLIASEKTAAKAEQAGDVVSRLTGVFTGWTGKTVFRLENGQVWQQLNPEQFQSAPITAPRVTIYPAMIGGFWLEVEGVAARVKVKPLKLE